VSEFRLGLLNPNTNPRDTDAMQAIAEEALGPGCRVVGLTAERGPTSIESAADDVVAAAETLALARAAPEVDAYLIACFGDPALDAVREVTELPVVGIGEAAYIAVSQVAKRFAVLTTLARGVPELEDGLVRQGLASRCVGVLPVHLPVEVQGEEHANAALLDSGRVAVSERHAEALVLACGAMADSARSLSAALGVPVCDGVAFGSLLSYALARSGLRTSKMGAYAWPEAIRYVDSQPLSAHREG
jgi:allantoin racemase